LGDIGHTASYSSPLEGLRTHYFLSPPLLGDVGHTILLTPPLLGRPGGANMLWVDLSRMKQKQNQI